MTIISNKPIDPTAHLSESDIDAMAHELDAIRAEVIADRGERDSRYIRRTIAGQRSLEAVSRLILLFSRRRTAWILGTAGLATAKIIENMEIGHNVMHGQWDWMRDPKIHSSTWEWDNATPARLWKHSHNEVHHTYTNIIGRDNDLGYAIMRVDEDQKWIPMYLAQPLWNAINALIFEWGIAAYDLELGRVVKKKLYRDPEFLGKLKQVLVKGRRQALRDYVIHPALSGKSFKTTFLANLTANTIRNVWTHSVIMCGHFPEGVETFGLQDLTAHESKGHWYKRQMLGSANISGSPVMHFMTGNLSHQIEHHIYPDLPSNRYREIAPRVRGVFEKFGLTYHSAPLYKQVYSAWHKIFRLSLPNKYQRKQY